MPRRLIPLLTIVPALLLPAPTAAEPPPVTQTATRTLSVVRSAGTVKSEPFGINCPATTCAVSKTVSRTCDGGECTDWPVGMPYTLTASAGPAGYTANWPGTGCEAGPACEVVLGDEAAGAASLAVTLEWRDTEDPAVTFEQPGKRGPSSYLVTAAGSDNSGSISGYRWTVDGVQQAATGGTLSLAGASHGTHAVAVRAVDGVNRTSAAVTRQVVVDKLAGVTASALPAVTRAASVPLSFTPDADVVASQCSVDGGAWAECRSGWSGVSAATADGAHTYRVRVTDDVGNTGESAALGTVVDRTLPAVSFTDGPAEGQQVVTRSAAITFSVAELRPGSVRCRLDAGAWAACAPGTAVALSGLADGAHAFTVEATDTAGNVRTVTRSFAVKVPAEEPPPPPPVVVIDPPAPPPPVVVTAFAPRFVHDAGSRGKVTTFVKLSIGSLPRNATVKVSCKGRGCKGKSRTLRHNGGSLNVLKALRGLKVRAGARIAITVSDGGKRKVATYVIRNGKTVVASYRCAKAGGKLATC